MTTETLAKLVSEMRALQRRYFALERGDEKQATLQACRKAERSVDAILKAIEHGQQSMEVE